MITLVWGVALVANGVAATTELGPTTTDQCTLVEDRFTLVSLDAYTGDYVEVAPLRRARGRAGPRIAVRRRVALASFPVAMDGMRERCVLLKFGELALKGRNRPLFVSALERNLRRLTPDLGSARGAPPRRRVRSSPATCPEDELVRALPGACPA